MIVCSLLNIEVTMFSASDYNSLFFFLHSNVYIICMCFSSTPRYLGSRRSTLSPACSDILLYSGNYDIIRLHNSSPGCPSTACATYLSGACATKMSCACSTLAADEGRIFFLLSFLNIGIVRLIWPSEVHLWTVLRYFQLLFFSLYNIYYATV